MTSLHHVSETSGTERVYCPACDAFVTVDVGDELKLRDWLGHLATPSHRTAMEGQYWICRTQSAGGEV